MADYIITNNRKFFKKIGDYNYTTLKSLKKLPKIIAFDTETTALKPKDGHMFACQIGTGTDNYLIDMQQIGKEITFEDVKPYLKDKVLVMHNACFDLGWCYKYDFWPEEVYDTFIASKILYNGYPVWFRHNFGFVMERELGLNYDKSEQKRISVVQLSTASAIKYCFNDVDRLLELMTALGKKIREGGYLKTYLLHCRYIKALAYMEQCGMPVDKDRWLEKMEEDKENSKKAQDIIHTYIYDNYIKYRDDQGDLFTGFSSKKTRLNLASTKQMIPLFEEMGIDVYSEDTASGKSIQEDIIRKSSHEFVDLWLDYIHAEHSVTTFGQKIIDGIHTDGRIYTSYNPILDTARISTRQGEINFLNFPATKITRDAFRSKEGFKMIVCDYEGQENVVGADLHHDAVMVASINEGLDLHCAFARVLFPEIANKTDEEIKKNYSHLRSKAKSPRFAFAYGGSGYTVAMAQNIPIQEGNDIEKKFKELHSGIYAWGDKMLEKALKRGYIESIDGFKLHLPDFQDWKKQWQEVDSYSPDFWVDYRLGKEQNELIKEGLEKGVVYTVPRVFNKEYELYKRHAKIISYVYSMKGRYARLCLNSPVQCISAHQTKLSMCYLFEYILSKGHQWRARICNAPHDEIVMEVEDPLVEEYTNVLTDCMIRGGEYYLSSGLVKMSAKANSGLSWYEAK